MAQPSTTGGAQPSRREFLKHSTTAAVATGLASGLTLARSAHAAGSDTIRIGLIGCGKRGSGAASQALKTEGDVKLVAMGDAFADRIGMSLEVLNGIEGLSSRIDVPKERQFVGFDAVDKVLATDVDLVILATPPGFRAQHMRAAIEAGKHVFAEKPVAVDAPGVRQALAAAKLAKEKNLNLSIGLHRRHSQAYRETIQRLHDGMLGDLHTARAYWMGAGVWVKPREEGWTDMEYQMRNWYYFNWLCGDHIVEQHVHGIDVISWAKNAYPVRAQGVGGRQVRTGKDFGEIYDHHAVEYEYADGSRLFSFCRHIPGCWNSTTEHIQGTKGWADISKGEIRVADGENWRYRGPKKDPFQVEHDDMFAAIRSGNPLNEGEYGAMSSMLAILGRMCTYSGQMLTWDEAINSDLVLMPERLAWDAEPPKPEVAMPGFTEVL